MAIREVHVHKIINVPFFIWHSCKLNDFDAGMVGPLPFQHPKKALLVAISASKKGLIFRAHPFHWPM
jgi:hypothetical protein